MLTGPTFPSWVYLWAKTAGEQDSAQHSFHPLVCHLIDTAMVLKEYWEHVASPGFRRYVSEGLGLDEPVAGNWVAFLGAQHDLGKATPPFQSQWPRGKAILEELGYYFPEQSRWVAHGVITAVLVQRVLTRLGVPAQLAIRLATTVGGHHGLFPRASERGQVGPRVLGQGEWDTARDRLLDAVVNACGVAGLPAPKADGAGHNGVHVVLAGLTSVADWIASDARRFPFSSPDLNVVAYADRAQAQARAALEEQGWLHWGGVSHPMSFTQLFGFEPRPLQEVAVELAEQLQSPALVIVEAPMGEGKTEAAMYLADRAGQSAGRQGAYFALPTEATSNQMFLRVKRFLEHRYGESLVNLQLLHGHASLSAEFALLQSNPVALLTPQGVALDERDKPSNVMAAEWFTHRKRGLLATYGVGTVDQALLAVLQTKHFFVRLFGLAHKTIIVDEVHAYDEYVQGLLERLISWLVSLGSTVIMLSATLPRERRLKLMKAFQLGTGSAAGIPPQDTPYPRVTWCTAEDSGSLSFSTAEKSQRRLRLTWVDGRLPDVAKAPFPLGERLQEALAGGGCAAVVCNTVDTAQRVYSRLKQYFSAEELDLLHARYPYEERARREERVLGRFGKDGNRPGRAVLVATQIIEQSLDLDFDLMVTYLAPIDLVLQRSGRLFRHDRPRPDGFTGPNLWVCAPEKLQDGVPRFDVGTESIYDRHILLRSWLALQGREGVDIPNAMEELIETVYDDRPCPTHLPDTWRLTWEHTRAELDRKRACQDEEADRRRIEAPDYPGELLERLNADMEEDNPEIHERLQALTRLGGPTVSVVLLSEPLRDPQGVPSLDETKRLMGRSVNVSLKEPTRTIIQQGEIPPGWRKSALLRHHRLLLLDGSGVAHIGDWQVRLDPELGLLAHHPGKEAT